MDINIIIPVLNEEVRLKRGILEAREYLEKELKNKYIITIVDNGSTDRTQEIAEDLEKTFKEVKYIKLKEKGVGLAFREGCKVNKQAIIGYMDVDLATDLKHIKEVYVLFEKEKSLNIINGSRLMKKSCVKGRTFTREITSRGLNIILKYMLKIKFTDAMCGFKFFRKETLEYLIDKSSDNKGWFYCAELLIRAEWEKQEIIEIPVIWKDDPNTKVNVGKLIKTYLQEIIKLYKEKKRRKL